MMHVWKGSRTQQVADHTETREECDKHGLVDSYCKDSSTLDNTITDVQASFERGFYIQWLNQQLDSSSSYRASADEVHEQRSERFVKLDAKQYEIARKENSGKTLVHIQTRTA